MKVIGARDLKTHLSEILKLVEAGEVVEITRRGRTIARIEPMPPTPLNRKPTQQEIAEAIESMDRLAAEIGKYAIPGVTVEQLIHDIRS